MSCSSVAYRRCKLTTMAPRSVSSDRRSRSSSSSSSPAIIVPAAEPLHGVSIDVHGDRLAQGVADGDRARVVHAAPDSGVVSIRRAPARCWCRCGSAVRSSSA